MAGLWGFGSRMGHHIPATVHVSVTARLLSPNSASKAIFFKCSVAVLNASFCGDNDSRFTVRSKSTTGSGTGVGQSVRQPAEPGQLELSGQRFHNPAKTAVLSQTREITNTLMVLQ